MKSYIKQKDIGKNQQKQIQIAEKLRLKIQKLKQELLKSKIEQDNLLMSINQERKIVQAHQNSLATQRQYSSIQVDIRNSQLMNSLQLERKRYEQKAQKYEIQIFGYEADLKLKQQEIKLQGRSLYKMRIIKLMNKKLEMLQQLSKLKPDGNLYISHLRVLLKNYIEQVRLMNKEIQKQNERAGWCSQQQYQRIQTKLKISIQNLQGLKGNQIIK